MSMDYASMLSAVYVPEQLGRVLGALAAAVPGKHAGKGGQLLI